VASSRPGPSSIAAAIGLALITLFVFFVLQDFGPESTARRFNSMGDRLVSYIPPTVHCKLSLLRDKEARELADISVNFPNDPRLQFLLDQVRDMAYSHASFEIVRLDYRNPSLAIAVVRYRPAGEQDSAYSIWIIELKDNAWRINPQKTYETFMQMRGQSDTF
jgi:hypothetical protein